MITEDTIRSAYRDSAVATRVKLDDGLKNRMGERLNVAYELIRGVAFQGSHFSVILGHADGGVQRFSVTYQFGEYVVLIREFSFGLMEWPFDSAVSLADWLNNQERRVLATATLLTTGEEPVAPWVVLSQSEAGDLFSLRDENDDLKQRIEGAERSIKAHEDSFDKLSAAYVEQEAKIDELKAWRMVNEQKLIDAGEELAHIRLKPLLDAACMFLCGEDMSAEVLHPGTDDIMTRLDVPTPTWEDLCDAVDRYRARNVKVFRLNEYEWYAAETLESAIGEAVRITGVPADEVDDDARELTEEEMDSLVFYDNMEDQEASETRTFREQLDRLIETETEFPTFFAGTEA
jgi:hypothetical protein